MVKIIGISDTHRQHWDFDIPVCDILIFSGDANLSSEYQTEDFANWFESQESDHKIFVAGNHDWFCQDSPEIARGIFESKGIKYLCHEAIEIMGINFFGSPYTPQFMNWAFMKARTALGYYWEQIPENTEVLITHGPAFGILDKCPESVGCEALLQKINKLRKKSLKHHIFGHIHTDGFKRKRVDNVNFYNVSLLDDNYSPYNLPFQEIEII